MTFISSSATSLNCVEMFITGSFFLSFSTTHHEIDAFSLRVNHERRTAISKSYMYSTSSANQMKLAANTCLRVHSTLSHEYNFRFLRENWHEKMAVKITKIIFSSFMSRIVPKCYMLRTAANKHSNLHPNCSDIFPGAYFSRDNPDVGKSLLIWSGFFTRTSFYTTFRFISAVN